MSDDIHALGRRDLIDPSGHFNGSLQEVADTLAACITVVAAAELKETAGLLAIARLDLMARLHDISEQELVAFARYLRRTPRGFARMPRRVHRRLVRRG